ncbi:hypothetical protein NQL31_003989 [Lotmaria passim]
MLPIASGVSSPFSPSLAHRKAAETVAVAAAAAAAPNVQYVTSAPTSNHLEQWTFFLLIVGALGAVAACVLPIYHFYKARSRRAEEQARGAEIKKSMEEMTARLYRTRQQYESGLSMAAPQLPWRNGAQRGSGDGSQEKAVNDDRTPPLLEDAFGVTSSSARNNVSSATKVPSVWLSGSSHDTAQKGEAAVADSSHGGVQQLECPVLTQQDLQSRDGPQLEHNLAARSVASSNSSYAHVHSEPSPATLTTRSPSLRSLTRTPSLGQLMCAPSTRAFAGMSKVEALRRALDGSKLHQVPSMYASTRSHSPELKRQQSCFVVLSDAFASADLKESSHLGSQCSSGPYVRPGSLSSGSLNDVTDTVQHSSSGTTTVGSDTAVDVAKDVSPLTTIPSPPPLLSPQPSMDTAVSSRSSRFVLARNGNGNHHVEGRPIIVDNAYMTDVSEMGEDAGPASAVARGAVVTQETETQQWLLSHARHIEPEDLRRTAFSSSPTPWWQCSFSPSNALSQNEEYSRLMDAQFGREL